MNLNALKHIRDFFFAKKKEEIQNALLQLEKENKNAFCDNTDWQELEYAYNRLFVGPMKIAAPPYASYYLSDNKDLMSSVTHSIRKIYHTIGVQVPEQNKIPDDFLPYELDALIALLAVEEKETIHTESLKELTEHLQKWIPLFCESIRNESDTPKEILYTINHLENIIVTL